MPMTFLMVDGAGARGEGYQTAIPLFYHGRLYHQDEQTGSLAAGGCVDYTVPPLEGLWEGAGKTLPADRNSWKWTSLMRVPDVTPECLCLGGGRGLPQKSPDRTTPHPPGAGEGGTLRPGDARRPYAEEQGTPDRLDAFL